MNISLTVCETPNDDVRDAILGLLADFNAQMGYPADPEALAITLTDDGGGVVGGLWGRTVYDWLCVDYLIVAAPMRGRNLGSKLLARAEQVALERGCVGVWLTTFSFQAQGFYEKLGYEVFGSLESSPRDNERIFLRKRLRA